MVAFTDQNFLSYLLVTFEFMTITVIFQIGLGLGFALLLSRNFKGCSTYRGILYLPNILSSVAVGLAFMFIFEPSSGFMNQLLASLGLPTSKWLASSKSSLSVIITIAIWQNFGYYMVLFIGGLQNISRTQYEAAEMDGAGKIKQFFHVTLPGLSPILFYGLTIAIIEASRSSITYIHDWWDNKVVVRRLHQCTCLRIYLNAFHSSALGMRQPNL